MRFVRFSLYFLGLSVAGCGSGPKVTLCDFTHSSGAPELICVDHENKVFRINMQAAEKERYLAIPSDDMRSLVEYCGLSSREEKAVFARAKEVESLIRANDHAVAE